MRHILATSLLLGLLLLLFVGCGTPTASTSMFPSMPSQSLALDQAWRATVQAAQERQWAIQATATANAQVLEAARATAVVQATQTARAVLGTATAQAIRMNEMSLRATSTADVLAFQATGTAIALAAAGTQTAIVQEAERLARDRAVEATATAVALQVLQTQAAVDAYEQELRAQRLKTVNHALAMVQIGLAVLVPLAFLGLGLWVAYQWARLRFVEGLRQELERRQKAAESVHTLAPPPLSRGPNSVDTHTQPDPFVSPETPGGGLESEHQTGPTDAPPAILEDVWRQG